MIMGALELMERTLTLLPQNTDPEISEQTIYGKIAETYWGLGEADKAIEIWKKHNSGMLFSHKIGHILAQDCNRTEEATPYLSEAMVKITADLCDVIIGYVNVFAKRKDFASAEAILTWGVTAFTGLRKGNKPNYLDRLSSVFLATIAQVQFEAGDADAARESLIKAKALAEFFDASPSYDESDIRFIDRIEGASAHDDMGATAMDAIRGVVNEYDNEAFTALWESVAKQNSTGCGEDQSGAQPTV